MVDPQTFRQNIALITGALIVGAALVILLIALLTGANFLVWRGRRARAEAAERRKRQRPDGTPLPPASRGICSVCETAAEVVYHTADGRRLCERCLGRSGAARKEQ